ncbi:hypothetical protein H7F10_16360 [Acidithiobacillus sp. HP-6]|uniref:hypothetical protein n=1 Tax=unclassified Acidithiobacillus TaxID=2614800 RepID=UPI00187A8E55|nr:MULTISPECIES: hypothetical protein [unclassified Acidithiobacillus]MBE7564452.1 hypothetical protein [Acidithiobacillus sp. HP-6]MBE7571089.1 hypothetical protein [Acidithiobacillus sp. HP-2]
MSVDYFGTFFTEGGFDFTGLLNADFFQPVRILFQNQHYVSAAKLLAIAIDSIAFVEYGDIPDENAFVKWLNRYADLSALGITADELWEHRNSLLHMSNLDSRKVLSGRTRRLIPYVGEIPPGVAFDETRAGYYNLQKLIYAIGQACGKWCETYGEDREKIHSFVDRYDLIASDARMLRVKIDA